ncbi:MAG: hypothetical protein Q9202_006882 [Teloschistes flavicans]
MHAESAPYTAKSLAARQLPIITYHGVSQASHEASYAQYSNAGYRIITYDVSGDPGAPQYSAVWKKRDGPPFQALSTSSSSALESFINTWKAQGYVLTQVAVTGFLTEPWFSVIMEQINVADWFWQSNIPLGSASTPGTFEYYNAQARNNQSILRSFGAYGVANATRYIAVWHHDPTFAKWGVRTWNEGLGSAHVWSEEISIPNFRPFSTALSIDYQYTGAWTDNSVGPYSVYYNITSTEYQTLFDESIQQGQYPINLHAGGEGADTRYAAIFALDDQPTARQFTQASGSASVSGIAAAGNAVRSFMTDNAVRSAQLSIYQNGVAKHQSVYEYTEPTDTTNITVQSQFLLAGLSEIFVAAAVQYCYSNNLFAPTTSVYPYLGFAASGSSATPQDLRSNSITIQQLLDHEGGYAYTSTGDPTTSTDPTYHMLEVASALGHNPSSPRLTKRDLATYMYTRVSLASDPGAEYHDSSYGYVLLTLAVERATGMDFLDFLTSNITLPAGLGITQFPTDAPTAAKPWAPTLVTPNDEHLGPDPYPNFAAVAVPYVYGGDGMIKEVAVGSAGLAGSATDVARFISTHAVQGFGKRASGKSRISSNAGAAAYAESRNDGVDWALVMNTREFVNGTDGDPLGDLVKAIDAAIDGAGL